tara:strand:+ start:375 stop:659 length:285 start_codon:yes stop_codon:yes gene_type:complete
LAFPVAAVVASVMRQALRLEAGMKAETAAVVVNRGRRLEPLPAVAGFCLVIRVVVVPRTARSGETAVAVVAQRVQERMAATSLSVRAAPVTYPQ